jgi:hypothetical protein
MSLSTNKYGGYIAHFKLQNWWASLTEEQRDILKQNHAYGKLDDGTIHQEESLMNPQKIFWRMIDKASQNADHREVALMAGVQALKLKGDPISRHYIYNTLSELYYKRRDADPEAMELSIRYCQDDIRYLPQFIRAWLEDARASSKNKRLQWDKAIHPRIPAFDRLRIIYEKQENYQAAADVCRSAVELGYPEYKGDIVRLEKKVQKV